MLHLTPEQQCMMQNRRGDFNKVIPAHKGENLVMRDDSVLKNMLTSRDPTFKGSLPNGYRLGKGVSVTDQKELIKTLSGKKVLLNLHQ